MPPATSSSGRAGSSGSTKSPPRPVARTREPTGSAPSARLNVLAFSGTVSATVSSSADGAEDTLNTRRVPRLSGRACGTVSSTYWPGRNRTGRSARNASSTVRGVSRVDRVSVSRTALRCPQANPMRLPTTSAASGVLYSGPTWYDTAISAPTTTASTSCCHRRGGRVSGSVSMTPPRNRIGYDTNAVCTAAHGADPSATSRTATASTATATKVPTSAYRRVRTTITSVSSATGTSSHRSATHQVVASQPVSPTSSAPAAAGLSRCRPRQARTYLDAFASSAARASVPRYRASSVGQNRKNRIRPVMIADSVCGRVRNARATPHALATDAATATAALTTIAPGSRKTTSVAASTSATTARADSPRVSSRYIVTRPSRSSSHANPSTVTRTPPRPGRGTTAGSRRRAAPRSGRRREPAVVPRPRRGGVRVTV